MTWTITSKVPFEAVWLAEGRTLETFMRETPNGWRRTLRCIETGESCPPFEFDHWHDALEDYPDMRSAFDRLLSEHARAQVEEAKAKIQGKRHTFRADEHSPAVVADVHSDRVAFHFLRCDNPHLDHDTCRSLAMTLLRETGAIAEVEAAAQRAYVAGQKERAAGLMEALDILEGRGRA